MKKYTQRQLKDLARTGAAQDVTGYGFQEMNQFRQSRRLDKIGYSSGVYGINGGLLRDMETGELFTITARNTALMMMMF